MLVDNSKDFTDTAAHWAEVAIDFATAHEMFQGTSADTLSPENTMTRAMLMTVWPALTATTPTAALCGMKRA